MRYWVERLTSAFAGPKEQVKPFASRETGDIIDRALKKVSRLNPKSEFTFPAGVRVEAPDGTEFSGTWGDSEKVELVKGRFTVRHGKTAEPFTLAAGWTQLNQMREFYNSKAGEQVLDSRGQVVVEFFFSSTGKLKYRKQRSVETPATVQQWGSQSTATDGLTKLFDGLTPFDTPKPVALVKDLIGWVCSEPDDIVLDFFGGSGTTAQAVWESNIESAATRRFILVQVDAPLNETGEASKDARKLGADSVADVLVGRLKRTSSSIKERAPGRDEQLDLGFRLFRQDAPALVRPDAVPVSDLSGVSQHNLFQEKVERSRFAAELKQQI